MKRRRRYEAGPVGSGMAPHFGSDVDGIEVFLLDVIMECWFFS